MTRSLRLFSMESAEITPGQAIVKTYNPDGAQPSGQTPECRRPERKRCRAVGGETMQKTHAMIAST
jgi:hypothetical protein